MIKGKCCIFGGGSLYRLPIYNLLAEKIDCDFFIGESPDYSSIESYNYSQLKNFGGIIQHKKLIGKIYWQVGALYLFLFKPYEYYVEGGPYNLTAWVMLVLSKFSKKKVVSWSHGIYGKETGLRKIVKIWYYKLCDMNLLYNQRGIRLMAENGVRKENYCVYNSVDSDHNLMIRKSLVKSNIYHLYFSNHYPIIIFVGRLTAVKRIDLLIKSISELKRRGNPVNLMLVGKEVSGCDLHKMVEIEGVEDNVYFYGPCYDDGILGNLFYNADVCVSPGNIGLTAMSSLSFGCPVISHNNYAYQVPEFEAIKPEKTGCYFKQGDYLDLANKIEDWTYKNKRDRCQIAKFCYEEIDTKWNIHTQGEIFSSIFRAS